MVDPYAILCRGSLSVDLLLARTGSSSLLGVAVDGVPLLGILLLLLLLLLELWKYVVEGDTFNERVDTAENFSEDLGF